MIDIHPVVEQLRIITGEYGDPYSAVMTITHINPTCIYISGLHGSIRRLDYKEFFAVMAKRGIRDVIHVRHNKERRFRIDLNGDVHGIVSPQNKAAPKDPG